MLAARTTDRLATSRGGIAIAAALALSACGFSGERGGGGMSIDASEPELRADLAKLAECPSPLDRLGIAHRPLRIEAAKPGEVIITVPSTEDSGGSAVRFEIDFDAKKPQTPIRLTWEIELASNAKELDLGENRLLNPPNLAKELEQAVSQYADYLYQRSLNTGHTKHFEAGRESVCRKFGRIADGLAVITDANLRKTLESQKRRDALGWLFSDNYKLKTESPEGAYWEAPTDYY